MPSRLLAIALAASCGLLGWHVWQGRDLRHPPGLRVEVEPVQQMIPSRCLCDYHGYRLTAVATYVMNARVLHTKHYWADGNDLVPYDVALGWGPMSDQAVLDQLELSQGNRFLFYHWQETPPLPAEEITAHCSNNHVIAGNSLVAKAIKHLRNGQYVQMRGFLVNATKPDGFHWETSLSRTDSGNGACELFYVEALDVTNEPG